MCNKCHYEVIDGIQVHVNGDAEDKEVHAALEQLVKIARNYTKMKEILASQEKAKDNPHNETT